MTRHQLTHLQMMESITHYSPDQGQTPLMGVHCEDQSVLVVGGLSE